MDELIKEYEKLDHNEFMTLMADHLSGEDYRYLDEIRQRKRVIRNELKEKWHTDV